MSDAGVVIGIDVHSAKQEEILMMDPSITPVVRQIVMPYIRRISSYLAKALRFGIAD